LSGPGKPMDNPLIENFNCRCATSISTSGSSFSMADAQEKLLE
jgi:hypothetical protein